MLTLQDVSDEARLGLRERKKRATRAALAGAAVRLAAERGAENVTVEAISQAAGVSPRTFFNYFDSHDDAFAMVDNEIVTRVRERVLNAPAELSPLDAVREALAAELAEVKEQHEFLWLRAQVLRRSPQLLARSLGAHMSEERGLAQAIGERLGQPPVSPPASASANGEDGPAAGALAAEFRHVIELDRQLGLYPKLLAATATTAVRVALQHWSAHGATEVTEDLADVFRRVFDQLATGLAHPTL